MKRRPPVLGYSFQNSPTEDMVTDLPRTLDIGSELGVRGVCTLGGTLDPDSPCAAT